MLPIQSGILDPIPAAARYLQFDLADASGPALQAALVQLQALADGTATVAGLGRTLLRALGASGPEVPDFPAHDAAAAPVPATPGALLCWLRGDDRGELLHRARHLIRALEPALVPTWNLEAFRYGPVLDLTGYEDGTENPQGDAALAAGFTQGRGPGLDGGSFLAIQQWVHDLDRFESLPALEQDHTFGRRKSDNEEIEDAPASAHVKRTAQEDFDPAAFVLRRSMPWAEGDQAGLVFTAFGKDTSAFAALLGRMTGQEDGIVDALFRFTRPVTGAYFWCPPMAGGRLDLTTLGR
ncbi:MAG: Dyp-type peroxidase [Pseudomonadota bacterium]